MHFYIKSSNVSNYFMNLSYYILLKVIFIYLESFKVVW